MREIRSTSLLTLCALEILIFRTRLIVLRDQVIVCDPYLRVCKPRTVFTAIHLSCQKELFFDGAVSVASVTEEDQKIINLVGRLNVSRIFN